MKVLFLTSSPGYGHTRAAEAIEMALCCHHAPVETRRLDLCDLVAPRVSAAIQQGYLQMTAEYPGLYQRLYDLDQNLYDQLAGKAPADPDLADFLIAQQHRWYPEVADRRHRYFGMSPLPYKNLDSALINTLINGICENRKRPGNRLVLQGLLNLIYRILSRRLKEQVRSYTPDLLVATQMYPGVLLSRAIAKGTITQPLIGVITDYGVHGVWVRAAAHCYCVAHESTAAALQHQGVPANRIQVTGIPLMPGFEQPPSQQQARLRLGLDDRPTLLVTGGQYGIGTVAAVRQMLQDRTWDYHILATASPVSEVQNALRELACQHPNQLTLFGWTDDMPTLLRAADIVAGKPGGLSVSEALACGRPFIATCSLGGQEAHNVRFLRRYGIGCQVQPTQLPDLLHGLFRDSVGLREMQNHAASQGKGGGAATIAALLAEVSSLQQIRQSAG